MQPARQSIRSSAGSGLRSPPAWIRDLPLTAITSVTGYVPLPENRSPSDRKTDRGAVREIQLLQDLTGVRRLLEPHRQPLLPQQGGEGGELLHIDRIAPGHHSVLGTFSVGRS